MEDASSSQSGSMLHILPRGSKYPIFEASGSKSHTIDSIWALKHEILGTWTLWVGFAVAFLLFCRLQVHLQGFQVSRIVGIVWALFSKSQDKAIILATLTLEVQVHLWLQLWLDSPVGQTAALSSAAAAGAWGCFT